MSRGPRIGRWLPWLAGLGLVLILAAAALAMTREGNVNNPDVEFSNQPSAPPPPAPKPPRGKLEPSFEWPVYGYDKQRTRQFALENPSALHPPYDQKWAERGSVLIEFPPVLGRHSLYVLKNNGALYAIHRTTGHVQWKRKVGSLAAASPAYAHNTLYAVLLKRTKDEDAGRVIAVNAANGKIRWSRDLPSRAESSPLYDSNRIYFGSENGTIYSLNAANGDVRWTHKAPGAVKGALAMDRDRNLYYGTYGGTVESLRAADGSKRWSATTTGGNFYSTAAVAYDRVYLGSTDGNIYSFGAQTGRLAWRHVTGGYVYGSPAVAHVPDGEPTVYIGSYDGKLYALNAQTGDERWTKQTEGKISGGTVVIGDMVFYSTLDKTTTAVGARTGKFLWRTQRGAFNPVVSDGKRLYLVGYSSLFALTPKR